MRWHLCVSLCVSFWASLAAATQLKIGTWNVRFDSGASSRIPGAEASWRRRREAIVAAIRWEQPDVFGLQEVLDGQLSDLSERLAEYDFVGVGRDDGKRAGEAVPIFWRRDYYILDAVRHHWLSPDGAKEPAWDASSPRMITIARLRSANGTSFTVANTHFDDQGEIARAESAKLVLALLAHEPLVFLTGDLNSERHEDAYRIITGAVQNSQLVLGSPAFSDSRGSSRPHFGESSTFTGFEPDREAKIIDCASVRASI